MTKILFFGALRDIMGVKEIELDFENTPILRAGLISLLAEGQINIADELSSSSVRVIADNVIIADDIDLGQSNEIAFLPPMSGG